MKVAALIIGLIGGLIIYGLFGGALLSGGGGDSLSKITVLIVPIAALAGAGMVMAKPMVGVVLMPGFVVILLLVLGFNFGSLIPVSLLAVAAILGYFVHQEDNKAAYTKSTS